MPIKWREQLAVGNAVIDEDHKELIKLINEYEEAVANKDLKSSTMRLKGWRGTLTTISNGKKI